MGCAAEATGLGFICFFVINPRVLSATKLIWLLFLFVCSWVFQFYPPKVEFSHFTSPPPPQAQSSSRSTPLKATSVQQVAMPTLRTLTPRSSLSPSTSTQCYKSIWFVFSFFGYCLNWFCFSSLCSLSELANRLKTIPEVERSLKVCSHNIAGSWIYSSISIMSDVVLLNWFPLFVFLLNGWPKYDHAEQTHFL